MAVYLGNIVPYSFGLKKTNQKPETCELHFS